MKRGNRDRGERKARKGTSRSLAAHTVFAPLLGLWGAALGGLVVMVLPQAMIRTATRSLPMGEAGVSLQPIIAALAALVLGGVLFVLAAAATRRARRGTASLSVAQMAARQVRPIDPARDLGSRSLDEPLAAMPFATPARDEAEEAAPAPQPAPETAPAPAPAPAPVDFPEPPRALDLSEFAQLPGRNGVWVEEPAAPEPAPAPAAAAVTELRKVARPVAPPPEPGTAALARLRAVPPSELSLAEMVERFAGALHEHRTNPQPRALTAADLAAREAALAEALKALAALTAGSTGEGAGEGEEPLRAALARLQPLRERGRGAA